MTKKKQQKQQKEEHVEAKDNASNENEKSLDLETQLAEAQQSAKDNWDKLLPVSYTHLTLPTILLV